MINIDQDRLLSSIISTVRNVAQEMDDPPTSIDENTSLVGKESHFDSLDMVTILIALEVVLKNELGIEFELVGELDEMKNNGSVSISHLALYIQSKVPSVL